MLTIRTLATPWIGGLTVALLWLAYLVMPLLKILQLITPFPLLLVGLTHGVRGSILAVGVAVAAALLVAGGFHPEVQVTLLLMAAFPVLAAWLLRGGWRVTHCFFTALFLSLLVLVIGMAVAALDGGDLAANLADTLNAELAATREMWVASMEEAKVDPQALAQVKAMLDHLVRVMALSLPGMVTVSWLIMQTGNLLMVRTLFRPNGVAVLATEDLDRFRVPFFLVWPLILAAVLGLFGSGNWRFAGVNAGLVLAMPYLLQGMAVINTVLRSRQASKVWWYSYYILLILWDKMIILVTVAGLLDAWFNFRDRFSKSGDDGSSGEA
ncbi:MAG: DUF2232 domain-containing protein [Magnetococcales bacterium]|nr:DUF2232 domain-containing protein [Magnetococcales bacterium]